MMTSVLILPGIGDSGPQHWQSHWQAANPSFQRVVQRDWDHPVCFEWVARLEQAVRRAGPETVLAAHSLGCLLVAQWAKSTALRIRGALLVAVPDPAGPSFPQEAVGFGPVSLQPFPFQSIVVASSDDPYGSTEHAGRCASAWGSRFITIESAGHINAASGLGEWSAGFALLQTLLPTRPLQDDASQAPRGQ
jgi:predicted alpha/beta hydrolase family esterase